MIDIICILDRSGSMAGLEDEVINAFNKFIHEQQKLPDKAKLTLVLFDNKIERPFEQVKLNKFKDIDRGVYFVRGMTSLNDAIGQTLNDDIFSKTKKAVVLIQTDGHENSSQEFTNESVKRLVTEKKKVGWDFLFMGANIDSFAVGSGYGLSKDNTIDFAANSAGITSSIDAMSLRSTTYRTNK